MKLDQWLSQHGVTPEAFGASLGIRGMSVRRYCSGERMPVPEIVEAISAETRGKVTVRDLHEQHLAWRKQRRKK